MGYSFLEPDRFWEEYLYNILANLQHFNLLPLTKDVTVCVKKYDLFYLLVFFALFNWIRIRGFKYEVKNVKSWHTDEQTDAGWKVISKIHSKFQLRWAKKSPSVCYFLCYIDTICYWYNNVYDHHYSQQTTYRYNYYLYPSYWVFLSLSKYCVFQLSICALFKENINGISWIVC